jgi:hypothetical protein
MHDANISLVFSTLLHKTPTFILWSCAGLILVTIGMFVKLWMSSGKVKLKIGLLTKTLGTSARIAPRNDEMGYR